MYLLSLLNCFKDNILNVIWMLETIELLYR